MTTTKELTDTKAGNGAIAIPAESVGLTGQADQDDILTPTCSIVQPGSADERGDAGDFYFADGTNVKELDVIVLEIAFTRALWGARGDGNNAPLCRSVDREMGMTLKPVEVTGKDDGSNRADGQMVFIPCAQCRHQNDDKFGPSVGSCKPGFTLMLYDDDHGPFLFFVKGSAIQPVKRQIVSPALRRTQRHLSPDHWTHSWSWKTEKRENDKGKFFVPVLTDLGPVEDPDAYRDLAISLRGRVGDQATQAIINEEVGQQEMPDDES